MALLELTIKTNGAKSFEVFIPAMHDADQLGDKLSDEDAFNPRVLSNGRRTPLKDIVWEWFCETCELSGVDELDPCEPDEQDD